MGLTLVGVNHRTAPLDVRERFAHARHEVPPALARLREAGADGGVLLSTCNRTEFYLTGTPDDLPAAAWLQLTERLGDGRAASEFGYLRRDRDAVQHLYRVAAGLDSMVLGESQIQGQVREAWELARDVAGPVLHRLFQSALRVGARVRTETAIGAGQASVASAGVTVASKIFGELGGRTALILGAGDMAEVAAACLGDAGVRVTLVANRTFERAREIAERLGADALTLDEAWARFADVDVVLSSTAAPRAIVTWERVAGAVARRGRRPLCILDLGVPRDVEPAVGQLEHVFLYNMDDLDAVAAQAAVRRRDEIPKAERIVNDEVETFWAWHDARAVVPVLTAFRARFESVRQAELAAALHRLPDLTPEEREHVEYLSRALLNKFLHEPSVALREAAAAGRGYALLDGLRRLFRIDGGA
jgi:glutamyl-tRNA reductase